jgi:hypothetical protein
MVEEKPKKKMGAPKREKTGKHMWIPAACVDKVTKIIQQAKSQ